jgi:DNA-directed RNA polymerase specialized sigma24 family protein
VEAIDWQALFFDARAAWPARLLARAQRRFGNSPDAEAAYNHALDAISRDGWSRLRAGYGGSGSAEGFMAITFLNLLEEYGVRKYGKRRAPAWVQRLGSPWTRIFELLCLRRMEPETIVDLLCARDAHEPGQVRRALAEVRGRIPRCGERVSEEPGGADLEPEPVASTPASALEQGELEHLLQVLAGLIAPGAIPPLLDADPARGTRARIAQFEASVPLSGQERLLLRLIYQENCSIPEAARSLGLNERTARRAHARLMERLRDALARHRLDPLRPAVAQ